MQWHFGAAVVLVGLAGCTTPAELRQTPPSAKLSSVKAPKAIALCIAEGWETAPGGPSRFPATVRELQAGYTVMMWSQGLTGEMMVADVVPTPSGSTISFWKQPNIPWDQFDKPVERCSQP